jgi:hypothetical protein
MSNCSEHKRDLFGQTDMKVVAEAIGDLNYETLAELLYHLSDKLNSDSNTDYEGGRYKISQELNEASHKMHFVARRIELVWQISKPFMDTNKTNEG